jgi:hypothetical protein
VRGCGAFLRDCAALTPYTDHREKQAKNFARRRSHFRAARFFLPIFTEQKHVAHSIVIELAFNSQRITSLF